jgi:hypothetical protein
MSPSIVRAWLDRHRAARLLREARRGVDALCTVVRIDEDTPGETTVTIANERATAHECRAAVRALLTARRQYANACEAWATVGEG